jgi:hypothetical protein
LLIVDGLQKPTQKSIILQAHAALLQVELAPSRLIGARNPEIKPISRHEIFQICTTDCRKQEIRKLFRILSICSACFAAKHCGSLTRRTCEKKHPESNSTGLALSQARKINPKAVCQVVVGSKKSDKPEIYLNAMRIGSKRVDLEKEMEPEERKAILKVIFRDVGFRSSGCGLSDLRFQNFWV